MGYLRSSVKTGFMDSEKFEQTPAISPLVQDIN